MIHSYRKFCRMLVSTYTLISYLLYSITNSRWWMMHVLTSNRANVSNVKLQLEVDASMWKCASTVYVMHRMRSINCAVNRTLVWSLSMKRVVHLVAMQIAVHMPLAERQHDWHDSHLTCKQLFYLNDVIRQGMVSSMNPGCIIITRTLAQYLGKAGFTRSVLRWRVTLQSSKGWQVKCVAWHHDVRIYYAKLFAWNFWQIVVES